jgi:hypothetical protein
MAALDDEALSPEQRQAMLLELAEQTEQMLAPDFVMHTCGIRLAASGGRKFQRAMGLRRQKLGRYRHVETVSVVADDVYAVVRGVFGAEHGDRNYRQETMTTWRFDEEGRAAETWENANGRVWDDFWIGCDPDFVFTSGEEFWLKDVGGSI